MAPRGKGRKEALGLGKRTCPVGDVFLARGNTWANLLLPVAADCGKDQEYLGALLIGCQAHKLLKNKYQLSN